MIIDRPLYLDKLIEKKDNKMIKVITGIRRCGKSFLLNHLFYNYLLSIGVEKNHIIKIKLDEKQYIKYRNPLHLSDFIESSTAGDNQMYYVFIDEIQFVKPIKNPYIDENESTGDIDYITFYEVLNGLLNKDNVDVYVTGSNSKMLSKDILTQFRGRGDQIHLFPLSFREFYSVKKMPFIDAYNEYQVYGGLPFVVSLVSEEEKSNYLKTLFDETYLKDVIERNKIKKGDALSNLVNVLASSIGSFTSPYKIETTFLSTLKIKYSHFTIANHINYLLDAFLINEAKRYDIKGRKFIGANSKYYFTDIGLRNAKLNFRQQEPTHMMENIIYNELVMNGFNIDVGIVEINEKSNKSSYDRKQLEVDFILNKGNKRYYIQSVYVMGTKEKQIQEKKSFKNINDSFKKIIILNGEFKAWYDDDGFLILSLKEFLLDIKSIDQ